MRKIKPYQIPVVGAWWVMRQFRYIFWRLYHIMSGRLLFKKIGTGVKFNGRIRVEHPYAEIEIGNNVMIGVGCYFLATGNGKIIIGDNVGINDGCYITSAYGITIGNNVRIAESVSIRDYNHAYTDPAVLIKNQGIVGGEIVIGNDVWIGRGVMITPGVTIGHGCVIGANAVVTKSVPEFSIAVGVPAKVIKQRG